MWTLRQPRLTRLACLRVSVFLPRHTPPGEHTWYSNLRSTSYSGGHTGSTAFFGSRALCEPCTGFSSWSWPSFRSVARFLLPFGLPDRLATRYRQERPWRRQRMQVFFPPRLHFTFD